MNKLTTYTFQHTLTKNDIILFGQLSGDDNPIHMDRSAALRRGFSDTIGYGMLAGVFFSTLIGKYLPGPGAVYLSQTLKFHKQLMVGQTLVITGTVVRQNQPLGMMVITTAIHNKNNKLIVSGEATVQIPKKTV